MPYKVNIKAWYNEQQIFKIWDCYVQSKKLKYFLSHNQYHTSLFSENNAMNIAYHAGLLVNADGSLYVNQKRQSVSICTRVDYFDSSVVGYSGITSDLEEALKQIDSHNSINGGIRNHVIAFAYRITAAHFSLGVLEVNFDETKRIIQAKIKIYNSLPECGGVEISERVKSSIDALIKRVFAGKSTIATEAWLQSVATNPIAQQNDGDSCGVISAENGKDIIDGAEERLKTIYSVGASNLRTRHLHEVNNERFEAIQYRNEVWQDPKFIPPSYIGEVQKAFESLIQDSSISTEIKNALVIKDSVARALKIKEVILNNQDIFKNTKIQITEGKVEREINLYDLLLTPSLSDPEEMILRDQAVDVFAVVASAIQIDLYDSNGADVDIDDFVTTREFDVADIKKTYVKISALRRDDYSFEIEDVEHIVNRLLSKKLLKHKIVQVTEENIKQAESEILEVVKESIVSLFAQVASDDKYDRHKVSVAIFIKTRIDQDRDQWSCLLVSNIHNQIKVIYYNPSGKALSQIISNTIVEFCQLKNITLSIIDFGIKKQTHPHQSARLALGRVSELLSIINRQAVTRGDKLGNTVEQITDQTDEELQSLIIKIHPEQRVEDKSIVLYKLDHIEVYYADLIRGLVHEGIFEEERISDRLDRLTKVFQDLAKLYVEKARISHNPEYYTEAAKFYQYVISISNNRLLEAKKEIITTAEVPPASPQREASTSDDIEKLRQYVGDATQQLDAIRRNLVELVDGNLQQSRFQDTSQEMNADKLVLQKLREHSKRTLKGIDDDLVELEKITPVGVDPRNVLSFQEEFEREQLEKETKIDYIELREEYKKQQGIGVSKDILFEEEQRRSWIEQQEIDEYIDALKDFVDVTSKKRDEIFIQGTRELFEYITTEMKSFLASLYKDAQSILGKPPCGYAIIALGSMALQQITPYSDLEFAILTENEEYKQSADSRVRNYFTYLTHLVHFRVINLGETVIPDSKYHIDLERFIRRGVNFDLGGKTPLGRVDKDKPYSLIQTPEKMARYLEEKYWHVDKSLPSILEACTSVYEYTAGDGTDATQKSLVKTYKEKVANFLRLENQEGVSNYKARAITRLRDGNVEYDYLGVSKSSKLRGNIEVYKPQLRGQGSEGKPFNAKQEIYRLVDRLLYDLAFYHEIEPKSIWHAIDGLVEKKVIATTEETKQAQHNLLYTASFATTLRFRTYQNYSQQRDDIEIFNTEVSLEQIVHVFHLPSKELTERGALFKYYYAALPLHESLESLLEGKLFEINIFHNANHKVLGNIFTRLFQYQRACECFTRYLMIEAQQYGEYSLEVAKILNNLGNIYGSLGGDKNLKKQIVLQERALAIQETKLDTNHYEVAKTLTNIGNAYGDLGGVENLGEKIKLQRRALEIKEKVFPKKHLEIAKSLTNLGNAYGSLRGDVNIREQIRLQSRALIVLKELSSNHQDMAILLISLGNAYGYRGDFVTQIKLQSRALIIFETMFGKNYHEVATTLNNLGIAYGSLRGEGNIQKQIRFQSRALIIFETVFDKKHPNIAIALMNLSNAYRGLKNYRKALELQINVLKKFDDNNALWISAQETIARSLNEFVLCAGINIDICGKILKFCLANGLNFTDYNIQKLLAHVFLNKGISDLAIGAVNIAITFIEQDNCDSKAKQNMYHDIGCIHHILAKQFQKLNKMDESIRNIEKAQEAFQRALKYLGKTQDAGLYTEYANFLLEQRHYTEAFHYLQQAIDSNDSESKLNYKEIEKDIITPLLQRAVDTMEDRSIEVIAIHYAYYLLISNYKKFQEAQVTNLESKETYVALFQSLDQTSNSITWLLLEDVRVKEVQINDNSGIVVNDVINKEKVHFAPLLSLLFDTDEKRLQYSEIIKSLRIANEAYLSASSQEKTVHVDSIVRHLSNLAKLFENFAIRYQGTSVEDRKNLQREYSIYALLMCNAAAKISTKGTIPLDVRIDNERIGRLLLNGGSDTRIIDRSSEYRRSLEQIRSGVKNILQRIDENEDNLSASNFGFELRQGLISSLYEDIQQNLKTLFIQMIEDSIADMRSKGLEALCSYSVVSFGSLARDSATPYSDLEFGILIKDLGEECNKRNKEYFRDLTVLVAAKVIALGESAVPLDMLKGLYGEKGVNLDVLMTPGFQFDLGGKTPLNRKRLEDYIDPVTKMIMYHVGEDKYDLVAIPDELARLVHDEKFKVDKLMPIEIAGLRHLYGDQGVTKSAVRKIKEYLAQPSNDGFLPRKEDRALTILAKGYGVLEANLNQFDPKIDDQGNTGKLYNVKLELYRLPDRILDNLCLFYGLVGEDYSYKDRLKKLQERMNTTPTSTVIFSDNALSNIMIMDMISKEIRLRDYVFYGGQREYMSLYSNRNPISQDVHLTEQYSLPVRHLREDGMLFRYYYTILPLYGAVKEFCHMKRECWIVSDNSFTKRNDLYVEDNKNKGLIHYRLGSFERAIGFLELALLQEPGDQELLSKTAGVMGILGRYDEAVTLYEKLIVIIKRSDSLAEAITYQTLLIKANIGHLVSKIPGRSSYEYYFPLMNYLERLSLDFPGRDIDLARVYVDLGDELIKLRDPAQAITYLERALVLQKRYFGENSIEIASTDNSLSNAYMKLEDFVNAYGYLNKILTDYINYYGVFHPNVATTYFNLALCEERMDHEEKALQHYKRAYDIFDVLPSIERKHSVKMAISKIFYCTLYMGNKFLLAGDIEEAIKYYNDVQLRYDVVNKKEDNIRLAELCYDKQRLDVAIQHLEIAINKCGDTSSITHFLLASYCFAQGMQYKAVCKQKAYQIEVTKAEQAFQFVLNSGDVTNDICLHTEYANFLIEQGRYNEALTHLRLAIDFSDSESSLAYGTVERYVVPQLLQQAIDAVEDKQIEVMAIHYAYYLLLLNYDRFVEEGVEGLESKEAYREVFDRLVFSTEESILTSYLMLADVSRIMGNEARSAELLALARTKLPNEKQVSLPEVTTAGGKMSSAQMRDAQESMRGASLAVEKRSGVQSAASVQVAQRSVMTEEDATKESLAMAQGKSVVGPSTIAGFNLLDVLGDGNCFFRAVADQIHRLNLGFLRDKPETTEDHDFLRGRVQGAGFRDTVWTDEQEYNGLVRIFPVVLAIIDTRTPEGGFNSVRYFDRRQNEIVHVVNHRELPRDLPIIRLAATGNHFLSVHSHPALGEGVILAAWSLQHQDASSDRDEFAGVLVEHNLRGIDRGTVETTAAILDLSLVRDLPLAMDGYKTIIIDSDHRQTYPSNVEVIYTNTQGTTSSCADNAFLTALKARALSLDVYLYEVNSHLVVAVRYPIDQYGSSDELLDSINRVDASSPAISWDSYKEIMVGNSGYLRLGDVNHGTESIIDDIVVLRRGAKAFEDKTSFSSDGASWFHVYLKTFIYSREIRQLKQLLHDKDISMSWQDSLSGNNYKQILLRLHPDKEGGTNNDFKFYNDFRQKFNEQNVEPIIRELQSYIHKTCHQLSVIFKALDLGVDAVRAYNKPTAHNIVDVAIGGTHLLSMATGITKTSTFASFISIGYSYYENGIYEAVKSAATLGMFMVAPYALTFTNIPYIGLAYTLTMTAYTGYNLANNAWSLYVELAEDSELVPIQEPYEEGEQNRSDHEVQQYNTHTTYVPFSGLSYMDLDEINSPNGTYVLD